jgi:peptide/nickel transport system permease protein
VGQQAGALEAVAAPRVPARSQAGARAFWRRLRSTRLAAVGLAIVVLLVLGAALAPLLTPYDPLRANNTPFLAPGAPDRHYFGTTAVGRDLFAAIAYGARASLTVGLVVAVLSTLAGVVVGSMAGYAGGWIDDALMRTTELFIVVPRFFLALVVVAIFGHSLLNIIVVLALLSWPPVARVVRADYLSLKQRDFVQAARLLGSGHVRIILREILPNALGPAIVVGSLQVSQAILTEASLAFLGLGDPDLPSWGDLLVDAQRFLTRAPWLALFPGLAITAAVVGFNLLGDGLARAINPRAAQRSS